MNTKISDFKEKVAIVILAYADYESLELALASHAKYSINSGVDIYILQNGRGTYDCERTYAVAKRYHALFPNLIKVVDYIRPGTPFNSLKQLFGGKEFEKYDYIIKLDDDVMVLTPDWVERLCESYIRYEEQLGDQLAYVTSLVNNNPYGFKKIIDNSKDLSDEYYKSIARDHLVGHDCNDSFAPYRLLPKDRICDGANGTIWQYPYITRWLHRKTTLQPEKYVKFASTLGIAEVNNKERYSINCLLFRKNLWLNELSLVEPNCADDEHLLHAYCLKYNKRIIANLSIPMVHLFFFSQRNECKDMIDELRDYYTKYFALPFPITICNNRLIEIENRLRFLEQNTSTSRRKKKNIVNGGIQCMREMGLLYTIKYIPKRLIHGRPKN